MVITNLSSDIVLRGSKWKKARDAYEPFFRQTNYSILLMSTTIGLLDSKGAEKSEDESGEKIEVPRTVFNNGADAFEMLLRVMILTSKDLSLNDHERLELAYSQEEASSEWVNRLLRYAYYGIDVLNNLIGETELETMYKLKEYLFDTFKDPRRILAEVTDDLIAQELESGDYF